MLVPEHMPDTVDLTSEICSMAICWNLICTTFLTIRNFRAFLCWKKRGNLEISEKSDQFCLYFFPSDSQGARLTRQEIPIKYQ